MVSKRSVGRRFAGTVVAVASVGTALALTACGQGTGSAPAKGAASSPALAATGVGTETRTNVWYFSAPGPSTCIQNLSFTPQDSTVTGGQPWGGISTTAAYSVVGGTGTMILQALAGRHDSSGPASWFNDHVSSFVSYGPTPIDNLNFAFTGELTINSDTYVIALGQGNAGGGNSPWYLGGQGFTSQGGSGVSPLLTPDGKYEFTVLIQLIPNDTFYVSQVGCS